MAGKLFKFSSLSTNEERIEELEKIVSKLVFGDAITDTQTRVSILEREVHSLNETSDNSGEIEHLENELGNLLELMNRCMTRIRGIENRLGRLEREMRLRD